MSIVAKRPASHHLADTALPDRTDPLAPREPDPLCVGEGEMPCRDPRGPMAWLIRQFGHPRGLTGRLVGYVMAARNGRRQRAVLERMQVEPGDRVLEVGFGPGMLLRDLVKLTPDGRVAGLDHSREMVRQARRRNAAAIDRRHLQLERGSADQPLPWRDYAFDRVVSSNVHHFLGEPERALCELRRVLRPGGRIFIAIQPRGPMRADPVTMAALAERLTEQLWDTGFGEIHTETVDLRDGPMMIATARRPS